MKISLVMTVRDEGHDAPDLIRDVQAQTLQPDEWIVVDGGSTDNTAALFRSAKNCTVVVQPGNIPEGRNRGIAIATGEIIVMTDAGCRLPPTWLASLTEPLVRQPTDLAIVGGRFRARLEGSFDAVQWALLDQLNFSAERQRSPKFSCRSLAIRRSVWETCKFPEWLPYGEDAWAQLQWARLGLQSGTVNAPVVTWNMRGNIVQFFLQHLRYARGDGQALMRTRTHWARVAYYTVLFTMILGLLALSVQRVALPALSISVASCAGVYVGLNAFRLIQVLYREQRLTWLPLSLLLLLPMLATLDLAKVLGFLAGRRSEGARVGGSSIAPADNN